MLNLGGKIKQYNQFLEAISEIYKKNHYTAYWVSVYMLFSSLLMNYVANN